MKEGKYRRAVFIVTYVRINNKIKYLILKRKLHWRGWEFPKGGLKPWETEKQALRREIREETGLNILKIKKFGVHGKYKYKKKFADRTGIIGQSYVLCSVEARRGKVKIDKNEHSGYKWLEFEKAVKRITHSNQKRCLKIVNGYLRDLKS